MAKLNSLPEWAQALIALFAFVGMVLLAYADVKSDVRSVTEKQERYDQDISEIKEMFKNELDRHHPRIP